MRDNLIDAWLSLPSPDPVWMRDNGITWPMAHKIGGLRWREGRLLVPAWLDPPSLDNSVADPVLDDIVSITPIGFARWKMFAVVLGEMNLYRAHFESAPIPVYRDILDWVRAGDGVYALERDGFIRRWAFWYPNAKLFAQDVAHAEAIDRALEGLRCIERPKIGVAA